MMLMATEHLRNLFKKACKMMREDDYRKFVQFKFADGDSMSSFESFVDGLDDVLLKKMNQILATSDRQVSSIMVEAMGEYFMSPSRGLSDPAKCKICLDVNLAPVQDDIRSITAARLFLVQSGEWLHHLEHSQTDKVHRRCYCARIDEYKSLASEIAETARSLLKTEFTEHCVPRSVWEYSIFVPDGLYCYHTALSLNSEVTDCLGRTSLHRLLDSAPSEPYIDDLPVKDVADLQDIMGRTALYIACAKGFRDIACRLLEKGADPLEEDFFHLSPFSVAAAAGFPPICKEVLNKRKIPADGIVDSLTFCLNNDEITTYQLLVTYEQFTPTEEERRLHLVKAAEYGSNQILQKLLDEFEDPNINPYGVGRTALTCAAFKKQHAAMEIILRHKDIDVNTKDYCGKTALILAAEVGFTRGVESLTNHPDVDVNARDDFGRTPFIIAAINGHYSVVRYLLQDVRVDTGLTGRNYSGSQTKFRNGLEDPEFFDHIVRTGRRTE
jgi:ankyrin repeat protein